MKKRTISVYATFDGGTGLVVDEMDGAMYLAKNLDTTSAPNTMSEGVYRIRPSFADRLAADPEFRQVALSAWATTKFLNPEVFEFKEDASASDNGDMVVYRVWNRTTRSWVRSSKGRTVWTKREHAEKVMYHHKGIDMEVVPFRLVRCD